MSLNRICNLTFLRTLLKYKSFSNTSCFRNLLSPSYQCTDVWNKRLDAPIFKGLDLDDFFVEMDKKFKAKKKVTALDIDLFVNSINSDERFEELHHILYLFRRTRSTVRTLDSTHHAVVRLLIKYGKYDLLLKILSNRIGYGIFPDHYAMNLAMDDLIEKGNYKDASRVASLLMLQEDLDNPVTIVLVLYACHMHLREKDPKPWHDTAPVAQEDEDEEEVLVRVPYLKNPHFDGHFDLTIREHLLGKTLYYATRDMKDVVGHSYAAVGLALHEKWPRLLTLLEQFHETKETILKESAAHIQSLLLTQSDQKSNVEQDIEKNDDGAPAPSTSEENKTDHHAKISNCLTSMENGGLIVDGDLHELVCAKVRTLPEIEEEDVKGMRSLIQEWENIRNKEEKREMDLVSLKATQLAVNVKKKELQDREQLLYFFENEDKHLMEIAQIEEEAAKKAAVAVSEEDYIVPELPRRVSPPKATKVRKTKASVSA